MLVVFIFNAHFELGWHYFLPALGTAFIAWGAFVLAIQAPWSAFLGFDAERLCTKKLSYSHCIFEVKKNQSEKWERLLIAGEFSDVELALNEVKSLRTSRKYSDVRLIEESGVRQVRIIFN